LIDFTTYTTKEASHICQSVQKKDENLQKSIGLYNITIL